MPTFDFIVNEKLKYQIIEQLDRLDDPERTGLEYLHEQQARSQDDQSGLDVELGLNRRLEPPRNTDRVADKQPHREGEDDADEDARRLTEQIDRLGTAEPVAYVPGERPRHRGARGDEARHDARPRAATLPAPPA